MSMQCSTKGHFDHKGNDRFDPHFNWSLTDCEPAVYLVVNGNMMEELWSDHGIILENFK